MKKQIIKPTAFLFTLIMVLTAASVAFAEWGRGRGPGRHHDEYGQRGIHCQGDYQGLTDSEIEQLKKEREAFFKETADLKQEIYAKKLALKAELAKKSPDAEKATAIQKTLSELESQFDLKRIEHQLKMKKINPKFGQGRYGKSYHKGPGFRPCRR